MSLRINWMEKEINIQMEANEEGNLYGNLGQKIRDRLINDFSIDIDCVILF